MKSKLMYIACFAFLLSSCEKSKELRYDADFSALNIWLGANLQKQDSLVYNYAFKSLNDFDTIKFSVRLTGLPVDQDREFQLEAIGGETERVKPGVHYEFPKYVLKANTYEGVFPIYIKRSTDFRQRQARIIFALKENGLFKKGIVEKSDLIVILKEEFSKPANWDADTFPYKNLSTFFGTYSNVKFQFITTVIGRIPVFKVRSDTKPPVPPDEVSYTQAEYWQKRCKTELAIYNAAHTKPLVTENEESITFP
ncbi:DUF4843 domain-containing protein [Pedobacter hiemivivus]|uniref:DUF4843 domain-containing protein n=1 Tax=Pedobacter hiemivivus TaxID=2530454 RepID=A0A4R0NA35_9SPHI|nr:DUF4843 domain-containing protein [Pedobacter hiemivivus]TCC97081.1 DUF4843 domain-containing protein [Pedobacter hiemivivus]